MPSVVAMFINLVLHSDLGEMGNDVFDLGISLGALGTSEVVQPCQLVKHVVGDGADDNDTNGVTPNNADSDNRGVAVLGKTGVLGNWVGSLTSVATQPAEDTEEGCENIDTADSADELPRGPGLTSTSDEDEPVLSERDLEEEHSLDGSEVVNHTTVGEEERSTHNPGTESK